MTGAMRSDRAQRAQREADIPKLTHGAALSDEANFTGTRTRLIVYQNCDSVSSAAKRVKAAGALIRALKEKSRGTILAGGEAPSVFARTHAVLAFTVVGGVFSMAVTVFIRRAPGACRYTDSAFGAHNRHLRWRRCLRGGSRVW